MENCLKHFGARRILLYVQPHCLLLMSSLRHHFALGRKRRYLNSLYKISIETHPMAICFILYIYILFSLIIYNLLITTDRLIMWA